MNIKKLCCLFFSFILLLISAFISFVFVLYIQSLYTKGNCVPPSNPLTFAHRQFTQYYQENTIEAVIEATKANFNFEFDIKELKTKELVLFHDDNMEELTGVNKEIIDLTWDEVKKISYKQTIHNKTYTGTPKIPLFSDA